MSIEQPFMAVTAEALSKGPGYSPSGEEVKVPDIYFGAWNESILLGRVHTKIDGKFAVWEYYSHHNPRLAGDYVQGWTGDETRVTRFIEDISAQVPRRIGDYQDRLARTTEADRGVVDHNHYAFSEDKSYSSPGPWVETHEPWHREILTIGKRKEDRLVLGREVRLVGGWRDEKIYLQRRDHWDWARPEAPQPLSGDKETIIYRSVRIAPE